MNVSAAATCVSAHRKKKILVVIIHEFFSALINWVHFFLSRSGRKGLGDLFFLCIDDEPNEKLKLMLGVQCDAIITQGVFNSPLVSGAVLAASQGVQSRIWLYRADMAAQLLSKGSDVLFADIDAYWLRCPFPAIDALLAKGFDIVGSRGTFPDDVVARFNSTLCLGFAYFRASAGNVQLLAAAVEAMRVMPYPDDQMYLNRKIYLDGKMAEMSQGEEKAGDRSALSIFLGVFGVGTNALRLALLPMAMATRMCNGNTWETATVAHCYSHDKLKRLKTKVHAARIVGLWKVRRDWENVFHQRSKYLYNGTGLHDPSKLLAVLTASDYSTVE